MEIYKVNDNFKNLLEEGGFSYSPAAEQNMDHNMGHIYLKKANEFPIVATIMQEYIYLVNRDDPQLTEQHLKIKEVLRL